MDSIPPWNAENRRSTAKENPMKQYLLSVQSVEGSAPRPPEAMQKAYQDVAAFNADLQAAGGGCSPADCTRRAPPQQSGSRTARC